jgi:hypothetical protein
MFTAAVVTFIVSCATSIPVSVSHPPEMNTDGIERLTVKSFEGPGNRQQIAAELTNLFKEKISGLGVFKMVDSSVYQPGAADAVFTGEVTNFAVQDSTRQQERKTQDGQIVQYTVYDRKVSLGFTYRMVRDRDGEVIGQKMITVTSSDSADDPSSLGTGISLAANAARDKLWDFNKQLVPWTSTEKLVLDKETSKDKALKARMKEADALVKAGSYKAAQDAYAKIYAETKSLAAGYNHAILAQPLESLEAAILLLTSLVNETGYSKASVELTRLSGFLSEGQRASLSTVGTSQQTIAIKRSSEGLLAFLPEGARVSLLNISKSEQDLTDVVIREISAALVNKNITVLERGQNLNFIRAEQDFQGSGDVSDDSYVSLGKMLGVETIVTFSITGSRDQRKLTVRAVSVETGQVLYNDSIEY